MVPADGVVVGDGGPVAVQDLARDGLEIVPEGDLVTGPAGGTAELLRTAGCTDPLDADALNYVCRDLVATLVRSWVKHPDQTPAAMTRRCARHFASAATLTTDGDPSWP